MVLMAPEKSCPNQGRFFVVYKNEKKETPLPVHFGEKRPTKIGQTTFGPVVTKNISVPVMCVYISSTFAGNALFCGEGSLWGYLWGICGVW